MIIGSVGSWREYSFICIDHQTHEQVPEDSPFHNSYSRKSHVFVETVCCAVPIEKQPFVDEIATGEEECSERVHDGQSTTVEEVDDQVCEKPGVEIPDPGLRACIRSIQFILKNVSRLDLVISEPIAWRWKRLPIKRDLSDFICCFF